jgi:antitoxin component of RelBE/YafQ-DinJ toxin-antitoxin module
METIQLTIDESLLAEVQQATSALHMTPSDFMRVALERALEQREIIAQEIRDAEGYAKYPQRLEEIEEWQSEQDWEDR